MLMNPWLKNLKARLGRVTTRPSRRNAYRPVLDVLEDRCLLSTFSVLNANDSGSGSLRQAILDANLSSNVGGPDLIAFNIPGVGVQTINVGSSGLGALPAVTDPVILDGTTQPGFAGTLVIELNGTSAGANFGLTITAGSSTVRGLVINRFGGGGLLLQTNGNNVIEGNFIGTNPAGTIAQGNSSTGIFIFGVPNNRVGGTSAGARNLISGNRGSAVGINGAGASGNLVLGNYLGTDITGNAVLLNSAGIVSNDAGVNITSASNNTVGGTSAAARNLIAGNGIGISIVRPGTTGPLAANNVIQGNYIGINAAGTGALGNTMGIHLERTTDTMVGGTTEDARNVISGNSTLGIELRLTTTGTLVQGNYIGTNAAGTAALGNGSTGVQIDGASSTIIGGNVIAGNLANGVSIGGIGGTGNLVAGNFIGTNAAGTAALGNRFAGVSILTANNTVGGTTAAARNLISGNGNEGVSIVLATGTLVQGNYIGTNAAGTTALGNGRSGVMIDRGSNNTVGGTVNEAGNLIAFNGGDGVFVSILGTSVATSNAILSNSIHSNAGLGIDLNPDGVTSNDLGDTDSGANNLQNFPVLTSVTNSGSNTTIQGSLNSRPSAAYTLQFFANAAADSTGFGEGQTFLGATSVTTDSSGNASFTVTLPVAVLAGQVVSATATDPTGNTSEFSQNRVVVAGNSAPVASADTYSVNEDAILNVTAPGVLANDSDPNGDPLTAIYVSDLSNGALTLNANGSFSYTPAANFFGPASFSYKASDGAAFSSTVTVSLTVNAVNDAPSFTKGADQSVLEDAGAQTITGWATTISANEPGQTLQFLVSNSNSALFAVQPTIASNGTLSYTPATNAHGTATVSVLLKDNGGTANGGQDTSAVQTFAITITSVNDAPVAVNDVRTSDEEVPVTIAVLANDFDVDDSPQTGAPYFDFHSQTVASDASGPLLISMGGTNFFAFKNLDAGSGSATVIGGFTSLAGVTPGALTFTLGDLELVDFVGTPTTATEVYAENDGTVVPFKIFRNGTLAAIGSDLVITIVTDRDPSSSTFGLARGFAQVTLSGVADDPFYEEVLTLTNGTGRLRATLGSFTPTTFADPETFVSTGTFLLNRLTVTAVSNGANGTAAIAPDGATVTYTPNANFHGTDSFTYTITDPDGSTTTATVNVNVQSINDAPQAAGDSYQVNEDNVLTVAAPGVLGNDSDVDGDPLSFGGLMTEPQHGIVQFQPDGSFAYTPAQNFTGTDSFTYRANDASLAASNVATVTVTILPVNDAPSFTAGSNLFVFEDSGPATILGLATLMNAGPANESLQTLSFHVSAANPALFSVQPALTPDGVLTFTPAANANGSTLVTVTLQDNGGIDNGGTDTSTPRTFSILIVPVNDAPTANNLSVAGAEDTLLVSQVSGSDLEGDPLTFAVATGPQHGAVSVFPNGFFQYQPAANFNGTDTFTFTASDGQLASIPATVTITVTPANDAATAVADDFTTHINTPLDVPATGSVVVNDFDIDGDAIQFGGLYANPTQGSVLFQADGTFRYTPQAGFVGTETFSYMMWDGQVLSAPGIITIHVLNDLPTANNDNFTVLQDSGITNLNVLGNDTSAPDIGETLTITSVGVGSAGGTLTLVGGGSIDYHPALHFSGTERFTYTVNDGTPRSDATASVSVTVEPVIQPSRIQGLVWEDLDDDGEVDFGEKAIANVAIHLTGRDDLGAAVDRYLTTDSQGIFEFLDLRPSDQNGYTLTESQPPGFVDGKETLGTVNGVSSGIASDNMFTRIALPAGSDGVNYNFGERPIVGGAVQSAQTATIGFWQNKNGQQLIQSLNGGPSSTQLGTWLAQTLPNMYGSTAGANNLTGKTNSQLATLFVSLFKRTNSTNGPPKLDAQVLATAFAVYVTNETLAGQTAVAYGFQVTANGLGAATFDVGDANRAAFGLAPTASTVMTVLDLLLATNAKTRNGVLYDADGSGAISSPEKSLREMANSVFAAINEQGDI